MIRHVVASLEVRFRSHPALPSAAPMFRANPMLSRTARRLVTCLLVTPPAIRRRGYRLAGRYGQPTARGSFGSLHDAAIQRSEAFLRDLAPFCFCGIQFAPIPELACAVVLRNGSDSLLNVVAAELERLAIPGPASQGDMDMRMLRVVVNYGDPFEFGNECPAPFASAHPGSAARGQCGRQTPARVSASRGGRPEPPAIRQATGHVDSLLFPIEARRLSVRVRWSHSHARHSARVHATAPSWCFAE